MPSHAPKSRRLVYLLTFAVAGAGSLWLAHHASAGAQPTSGLSKRTVATYFVDPATGQSREPTPQELADLQAQGAAAADIQLPEPITAANGMAGLRLTDDQAMFMVATKNADGTISFSHADGRKAAAAQVKGAATGGVTAGKEQRLER